MSANLTHEPDNIVPADERSAMLVSIRDSPAKPYILRAALQLRELGFDTTDPDVIEKAIAAGNRAYQTAIAVGGQQDELRRIREVERKHADVVYYMRLGPLTKIGTTVNIGDRVAALNPQAVAAVEWGDRRVELGRHRQFAPLHEHGEWFRTDEPLATHIANAAGAFRGPAGELLAEWLRSHGVNR